MTAYATLPELAAVLDKESGADDFTLALALDGATAFINRQTARRFDAVTETRAFDTAYGRRLLVGDLVSVTAITLALYTGATPVTLAGTDYVLGPRGDGSTPYQWVDLSNVGTYAEYGRGYRLVSITGVWGWPAVPTDIKQLCLSLAARWFKATQAGFSDVVGVDPMGTPLFTKQITALDWAIIRSYKRLVLA